MRAGRPAGLHVTSRRTFLRRVVGGGLAAAILGRPASAAAQPIQIVPRPASAVAGRGRPGYLPCIGAGSQCAAFLGHVNRGSGSGVSLGGIDYAPLPGAEPTTVCPVAGGVVTGVTNAGYGGHMLWVGHGLGWKSSYAHLAGSSVGYREHVTRRRAIAVMGSSGTGANRVEIGGTAVHLHLSFYGPVWTPLYRGIDVQDLRTTTPTFRYSLDAEQFSLGGDYLYYSRDTDQADDAEFLAAHDAAVQLADTLLDRLATKEAAERKKRLAYETETGFANHVDQRLWFVWERLEGKSHPFSAAEVADHRHRILELMKKTPRLTAPLVERPA